MSAARSIGVAAAIALAGSGCFFTDPVNERPIARITMITTGVVFPRDTVIVSGGTSKDPDGEGIQYKWETCRSSCSGAVVASGTEEQFAYQIPPGDHEAKQIRLTVSDRHGAQSQATVTIAPGNRAPEIDLQLEGRQNGSGGFLVGHPLLVKATAEDLDGDMGLTFAFTYYPPEGVSASPEWTQVDTTRMQLVPDVAGNWQVEVVVNDGLFGAGEAPSVRIPVRVDEDRAPCIVGTTPPATTEARYIVGHDDPPRLFRVDTVTDELDPYPVQADPLLEPTRFRWSIGPAGGPLAEVEGLTLGEMWLDPSVYDPGSIVGLRVEAFDRVDRPAACDESAPVCPPEGSCVQRVSWEVEIR